MAPLVQLETGWEVERAPSAQLEEKVEVGERTAWAFADLDPQRGGG